jgi:hypothetical protein
MKSAAGFWYWPAGLALSAAGVVMVKQAPALVGPSIQAPVAALGYLVSCGGLLVIMLGIRRRAMEREEGD